VLVGTLNLVLDGDTSKNTLPLNIHKSLSCSKGIQSLIESPGAFLQPWASRLGEKLDSH
jgi:hypothetical protein